MLILKMSLLTNSGLLLATKPETKDADKEILTSGLMTAILAYAKEVGKKAIQSLSYHDRTTSFLDLNPFIIIVEITSAVEPGLQDKILTIIKDKASLLLKTKSEDLITEGEASLILEELYNETREIDSLGLEKPFSGAKTGWFQVEHGESTFRIVDERNCTECVNDLAKMIDNGLRDLNFELHDQFMSGFVPYDKTKEFFYFIVDYKNKCSKIAILRLHEERGLTLFRLKPHLDRQIDQLVKQNPEIEFDEIVDQIRQSYDTKQQKTELNRDLVSLNYIDKNIKNVEKAIYSIIIGDPVIVVGDAPSTRIVTHSLAIFGQHLNAEVIEWLSGEAKLGSNITGMSPEMFRELEENKIVDSTITVVDLNKKRVRGNNSSSYFKKLFDKTKKDDLMDVYAKLGEELNKLVSQAIEVTALALDDSKLASKNLSKLSGKIADGNRFDKIMKLATKRNPLIKKTIEELNSTISAAENYLANF